MNDPKGQPQYESILLRVLWMVIYLLVWQVAQFILGAVVLVQLIYRLIYGAPSASLMNFGDSLSQFLAQIGRFGTFHSDQKPWPFADWPTPRTPEGEAPHAVAPLRIRSGMRSRSYETVGIASWRGRAARGPSRSGAGVDGPWS